MFDLTAEDVRIAAQNLEARMLAFPDVDHPYNLAELRAVQDMSDYEINPLLRDYFGNFEQFVKILTF